MSWQDVQLALHHLSEERVGRAVRAVGEREDAQYQQSLAALKR